MKSDNQTILTPLVSLPTPGKATVTVVIVADPVSKNISTLHFLLEKNIHFYIKQIVFEPENDNCIFCVTSKLTATQTVKFDKNRSQ